MLKKENVYLKQKFSGKDEILKFIALEMNKIYSIDEKQLYQNLVQREEAVSTGFENGIAIPHAKIKGIDEPVIIVVQNKGIDWPSMDTKLTDFIICIIVPEGAETEHLKILGSLTRKLASVNFVDKLKSCNEEQIVTFLTDNSQFKKEVVNDYNNFYVAVTKCTVGIAHTYLAAEKIEKLAEKKGYTIKVETQGSAGVENKLTKADIDSAKGVIIAADVSIEGIERFGNKQVLNVTIKKALDSSQNVFDLLKDASIQKESDVNQDNVQQDGSIIKYLMNGVSHMIPFVVLGGLLIAISLSFGSVATADGLIIEPDSFWMKINQIGVIGFTLMIPILAGYIAYAMAGRAALAPAMIGAMVANSPEILGTEAGTGFLGAIAVGLIAGYLVNYMNSWNIKKELKPIMPIFVIPILGTLVISFIFIYILGQPINWIMDILNNFLMFLSSNVYMQVFLGMALGAMVAIDMGGPINKVAFVFGVVSITSGNPEIMGAVAAAIAVPPLSMGLATLIRPKKFNEEERGAGIAGILMGMIGITEGAIPFAAGDPKRVIPSIMVGSMVASTLALTFNVTNMVPHGGPIVGLLGATSNPLIYFGCITIGTIVSALLVIYLKKDVA